MLKNTLFFASIFKRPGLAIVGANDDLANKF